MYARERSSGGTVVQRWPGGVSWQAHPSEPAARTSHAVVGQAGCWLVDPLVTPELEEWLPDEEPVVGILALFSWHARDADRAADRFDVPVYRPRWIPRIDRQVAARCLSFRHHPPDPALHAIPSCPVPGWDEAFLWHRPSRTLLVPESLGTADRFLIGDERLGVSPYRRFAPPSALRPLAPDRVLVGHGDGVTTDAPAALRSALAAPIGTLPAVVRANGWELVKSGLGALGPRR